MMGAGTGPADPAAARPIALANMLANRNFSLHIISTLANMK